MYNINRSKLHCFHSKKKKKNQQIALQKRCSLTSTFPRSTLPQMSSSETPNMVLYSHCEELQLGQPTMDNLLNSLNPTKFLQYWHSRMVLFKFQTSLALLIHLILIVTSFYFCQSKMSLFFKVQFVISDPSFDCPTCH